MLGELEPGVLGVLGVLGVVGEVVLPVVPPVPEEPLVLPPMPVLEPAPVLPELPPELLEPEAASRRHCSFSVPVSRSQRVELELSLEPLAELPLDDGLALEPVDELGVELELDGVLELELDGVLELEVDGVLPMLDDEPLLPVAPVLPDELPEVCAIDILPILNSAAATAAPNSFIFIVYSSKGSRGKDYARNGAMGVPPRARERILQGSTA